MASGAGQRVVPSQAPVQPLGPNTNLVNRGQDSALLRPSIKTSVTGEQTESFETFVNFSILSRSKILIVLQNGFESYWPTGSRFLSASPSLWIRIYKLIKYLFLWYDLPFNLLYKCNHKLVSEYYLHYIRTEQYIGEAYQ